MKSTRITAYETKTKQAEIFRRAAAGENFVVTNNGVPQVEIRKVKEDQPTIAGAIKALASLQKRQLAEGAGGSQSELKRLVDEGRD